MRPLAKAHGVSRLAPLCLLLTSGLALSCKEPGYRAATLTREGVAALQAGVSEQEIVGVLGPPVSRMPGPNLTLLAYAKPSHRKLGTRRFGEEGLTFLVYVEEGRLKSAYIYDPPAVCSCNERSCASNWAQSCLDLFPAGAGHPIGSGLVSP